MQLWLDRAPVLGEVGGGGGSLLLLLHICFTREVTHLYVNDHFSQPCCGMGGAAEFLSGSLQQLEYVVCHKQRSKAAVWYNGVCVRFH